MIQTNLTCSPRGLGARSYVFDSNSTLLRIGSRQPRHNADRLVVWNLAVARSTYWTEGLVRPSEQTALPRQKMIGPHQQQADPTRSIKNVFRETIEGIAGCIHLIPDVFSQHP